ncbi:hypothetical protein sscle_07g058260 [Sclerotinia sclerotiorum 1980 UF-70]|uniref:Short chain dehydrogenase n=1 Tax=Sclerotinia sclerotiorum (strain ATCC 18683 / 1980 / Ss-1) TaxID=665079 RepID=A0A1D9Q824_SCLS1|nr:hypothetical protein sscle_07g058260 [Sclerotinia sclerotiorum 1980 UF-70]
MAGKYQKLAGKHVIIIGGSSGIGYAVAEASLESGASVTISSSSADRVAQAVQKLQRSFPEGKIAGYACDLSKSTLESDVERLFEQTGKVDHIVFTAGQPITIVALKDTSLEDMYQMGQVRFFGQLMVAKVGSRYLNEGPKASITLTTGSTADKPAVGWSVFSSYAAGLHGMARALAVELAPVRVNVVSPGPVKTELWEGFGEELKTAIFEEMEKKLLTRHVALPEEIAESYLWLMKDSSVTGTVVRSDSGSLLV